jgi:hypothetical protein
MVAVWKRTSVFKILKSLKSSCVSFAVCDKSNTFAVAIAKWHSNTKGKDARVVEEARLESV